MTRACIRDLIQRYPRPMDVMQYLGHIGLHEEVTALDGIEAEALLGFQVQERHAAAEITGDSTPHSRRARVYG